MTGISASFPADGLPVRQLAGASAPVLYANRERSVLTSVAMEPAGGRPTSPAGSLAKVGGFAAFAICSPLSMLMYGWGFPVPGTTYAVLSLGGSVLFLLEAWRDTRDQSKREADRLLRIETAKRRARESWESIRISRSVEAEIAPRIADALKVELAA